MTVTLMKCVIVVIIIIITVIIAILNIMTIRSSRDHVITVIMMVIIGVRIGRIKMVIIRFDVIRTVLAQVRGQGGGSAGPEARPRSNGPDSFLAARRKAQTFQHPLSKEYNLNQSGTPNMI